MARGRTALAQPRFHLAEFTPGIAFQSDREWFASPSLRRPALLGGGSLIAIALLLASVPGPALADGGRGAFFSGGAGGADSPTGPGGAGGSGSPAGGGGGGGGAGATGGAGGQGTPNFGTGAGGAGGAAPGASGGDGAAGSPVADQGAGGGGGGGAHGFVGPALPVAASTGGNGGNGGSGNSRSNDGGGGGAGGYGAVVTGAGNLGSVGATLIGGNGGNGSGSNGSGGSGGIGLLFSNSAGTTFTVNGTVTGGNGGTGFEAGPGGAGIVGQNLSVTIGAAGSVAGGSGANAITFTGGANTLSLGGGTLLGNIDVTGSLSIAPGASASLSNVISGTGSVIKDGPGTLTLTGANTYSGATTVSDGTLKGGANNAFSQNSDYTVNAGATLDLGGGVQRIGSLAGNGTVTTSVAGNGRLDIVGNASTTFGGTITDGAGTIRLFKNGTGTLTLTNANTYSGGTLLAQGGIEVGNNTALGAGGATMLTGTTLRAGAANVTLANDFTLMGGGNFTFDTQANTLTISRFISQSIAPATLVKTGSGTLVLGSFNGYGGTNLVDGTIRVEQTEALSGGGLAMANGTTLQAGGALPVILNNTITLAGTGNFDTNGRTLSLGGVISGVAGALTKTGAGMLILSNNGNTYAGPTTVAAGELRVNGTIASATTVQSGGTLSGIGTVNGLVTVQSGGTLSAGQSPGTLTVAALNLNAGSTSVFELGAAGAVGGVSNDLVNVTGNLALGGTLSVNAPSAGYYRLFNYGGALSGSFASVTGSAQGMPTVLTNVANQVNLSVLAAGQQLQFWDGADLAGNGVVNGGTGTWNAANTNWTGAPGQAGINDQRRSSVGVFAGAASGTVTVVGTQAFDTLQFSTTGYLLNAGAAGQLQLAAAGGAAATINTDAGIIATINAPIVDGTSTALIKVGLGALVLGGANTYTGGTTIDAGTLTLLAGGSLASGVTNNATFFNAGTVAGTLANTATATTTGTVAGGLTNSGILNAAGTVNGAIANNAGTFNVTGALAGDGAFTNASGATLAVGAAGAYTLQGLLTNSGVIAVDGGGQLTAAGGITNAASFTNNIGATVSGLVTNSGNFSNAGTLNGSLANTAGVALNNGNINGATLVSGGTLTGTGTVASLNVTNGGSFAPGNGTPGSSMTVTGSLALQSGALYLVQLNPTTSSFASVGGTATLGGATVAASFAPDAYVSRRYTILTATGGVSGTFDLTIATNLPAGFGTTLSYDANNVFLDLDLNLTVPGGLNGNQQQVAGALTDSFNRNGRIPLVFATLSPAALTQISGETATGSQQTTFDAMNMFMGLMTDPFIAGRGDPIGGGGNPNAFADESFGYAANGKSRPKNERDAYAAIYRKAPAIAPNFEQRWSVWAAGFGGSQTTDGNMTTGSNNTRSSIYGGAAGADYRISPTTLAGFALAGGGTNFSVVNAGSGRSDLFQAGAFIRHNIGAAYLSGALAYGWQDITTDRTVTVAGIDRLRAQFNANAWSGRVEGGYRFVTQGVGLTPYAAGQFTTFELPAYAESVVSGANTFALAYNSRSVTNTRSELGLRSDKSFAMQNGIFTLRGRAAWAHDFNPDRAIGATFQTLPGASFVVNGAARAADAALVTAAAEMKWINGWSIAGTFEGEFSKVTDSYAGKGVVRYAW